MYEYYINIDPSYAALAALPLDFEFQLDLVDQTLSLGYLRRPAVLFGGRCMIPLSFLKRAMTTLIGTS